MTIIYKQKKIVGIHCKSQKDLHDHQMQILENPTK